MIFSCILAILVYTANNLEYIGTWTTYLFFMGREKKEKVYKHRKYSMIICIRRCCKNVIRNRKNGAFSRFLILSNREIFCFSSQFDSETVLHFVSTFYLPMYIYCTYYIPSTNSYSLCGSLASDEKW